jgi:hypothetical protein
MKRYFLSQSCEEVDAQIFSGDVLLDDDDRKELRGYAERWIRAIDDHEFAELTRSISNDETTKTEKEQKIMRQLNEHKINPANDIITITVTDEPGAGGANHRYHIDWIPKDGGVDPRTPNYVDIVFQNGPIAEAGVNGITQEVLLAIVADRLRSFQKGPYSCKANACALTHIEEAQHWLQQRTIERMRRGVEGTHAV